MHVTERVCCPGGSDALLWTFSQSAAPTGPEDPGSEEAPAGASSQAEPAADGPSAPDLTGSAGSEPQQVCDPRPDLQDSLVLVEAARSSEPPSSPSAHLKLVSS